MLLLLLAIFSSSMISIVMRISSDKISNNLSMLAVNYLVCSLLGAGYAGFDVIPLGAPGLSRTVGLGIIGGVLYLAGFVLHQRSLSRNGIVMTAIFNKLGLLVPITLSVVLFGEVPTWVQVFGFCIAVGAIILINIQKSSGHSSLGLSLLILLLVSGSAEAMAKVFDALGNVALSDLYLFYIFAVALVLCLILVILKKERPGLWELLFGALIGIPNFFSSKFLLGALRTLPAVVVYPTFSVATMLVLTLTGVVMFRERLCRSRWIALGAIIVALVLLNI